MATLSTTTRIVVSVVCVLLPSTNAIAVDWMPLTLSGSVGYGLRFMTGGDGDNDQNALSQQALANIRGTSFIYRPWLGTADANVTFAYSNSLSENEQTLSEVENSSSILAGGLNLSMFPQSKMPLTINFSVNDTRVDNSQINNDAFIILGGGDSQSQHASLNQAILFSAGHRMRVRLDHNRWESDNAGEYTDSSAGLDGDFHWGKNDIFLNLKQRVSTRSVSEEDNQSSLVDLGWFFRPSMDMRVDTRVNVFSRERGFDVPGDNRQSGTSKTTGEQLSSFVFFRPKNNTKWSLSGGARFFGLDSENVDSQSDLSSYSFTGGGFYHYSRHIRFDTNATVSSMEGNDVTTDTLRGRLGANYESNLIPLFGVPRQHYQWFANAAWEATSESSEDAAVTASSTDRLTNTLDTSVGHNAKRSWLLSEDRKTRMDLGVLQSMGFSTQRTSVDSSSGESSDNVFFGSLTQGVNWGFFRSRKTSAHALRVTFNDNRRFIDDSQSDRQLFNIQYNWNRSFTRRSTVALNLSQQFVKQDFETIPDNRVRTTTARVDVHNSALFGVPRLYYTMNITYSLASDDALDDRAEWGNRLDYRIGQLSTYLDLRYLRYEDQQYTIAYLKLERKF